MSFLEYAWTENLILEQYSVDAGTAASFVASAAGMQCGVGGMEEWGNDEEMMKREITTTSVILYHGRYLNVCASLRMAGTTPLII